MLAVCLKGGLGNQLFQWSLACRLAYDGCDVALDPRLLNSGSRRLSITPLCSDLRLSTQPSAGITLSRRLRLSRTLGGYRWVREPHVHFWPAVFQLRGRCVLEGYWQSPRYFTPIADDIRRRVASFAEGLLTAEGRALHAEIGRDPGAVSVHVRRGDYVTDPRAAAHLGFLGLGYYERALGEMRQRGAAVFYVFSDDAAWARRHLQGADIHVVPTSATCDDGGELALMAACSGHVVANSSFSWWGAWLDVEPRLGVVAPATWFRDESVTTDDLLPSAWLRVSGDHGSP